MLFFEKIIGFCIFITLLSLSIQTKPEYSSNIHLSYPDYVLGYDIDKYYIKDIGSTTLFYKINTNILKYAEIIYCSENNTTEIFTLYTNGQCEMKTTSEKCKIPSLVSEIPEIATSTTTECIKNKEEKCLNYSWIIEGKKPCADSIVNYIVKMPVDNITQVEQAKFTFQTYSFKTGCQTKVQMFDYPEWTFDATVDKFEPLAKYIKENNCPKSLEFLK